MSLRVVQGIAQRVCVFAQTHEKLEGTLIIIIIILTKPFIMCLIMTFLCGHNNIMPGCTHTRKTLFTDVYCASLNVHRYTIEQKNTNVQENYIFRTCYFFFSLTITRLDRHHEQFSDLFSKQKEPYKINRLFSMYHNNSTPILYANSKMLTCST